MQALGHACPHSSIPAAVAVSTHDPQPSRALQKTRRASSQLSIPLSIPLPTHPQHQHPTWSVSPPQGIRWVTSLRRVGAGSPGATELEPFAQPFSHSESAPCAKAELNWKNTHNDLLWNVV